MKINVLRNYGCWNTNERRILPGVYEAGDERLFGLAEYLVDNGHAVVTEDESVSPSEDELIPVNPPAELPPPTDVITVKSSLVIFLNSEFLTDSSSAFAASFQV